MMESANKRTMTLVTVGFYGLSYLSYLPKVLEGCVG